MTPACHITLSNNQQNIQQADKFLFLQKLVHSAQTINLKRNKKCSVLKVFRICPVILRIRNRRVKHFQTRFISSQEIQSFVNSILSDVRSGKASAVMGALHHSVVLKRELSRKTKLSELKSIFVPILTHGHESWVMTEKCGHKSKRPK